MEFTLGSLIGIALATMFFGYFFGLFEGRAQGYRRRKKEEPLEREAHVAVGKTEPESGPPPATAAQVRTDAWLQVYADGEGRPSLDLDGEHVDTAHPTSDQHQRLIQLMLVMRPWVEAGGQSAKPESAAGAPELVTYSSTETGGGTDGAAAGWKNSGFWGGNEGTQIPKSAILGEKWGWGWEKWVRDLRF